MPAAATRGSVIGAGDICAHVADPAGGQGEPRISYLLRLYTEEDLTCPARPPQGRRMTQEELKALHTRQQEEAQSLAHGEKSIDMVPRVSTLLGSWAGGGRSGAGREEAVVAGIDHWNFGDQDRARLLCPDQVLV